jgi:dehydrogenase/reductase SDR family protein 7B
MDFANKTVWITGASAGIGACMARMLAEKGAQLILSARNEAALERVRNTCQNPATHLVLPLDLERANALPAIVAQAIQFTGVIDVLFNNGGISQRSLAMDTVLDVDRRIMEVDYFGTIALTKLVLPHMKFRHEGLVASVASVAGKVGSPRRSAYSGAKHALIGFMNCLRPEVAGFGIRVFVVSPGFVNTDISINALTGNGEPNGVMEEATEGGLSVESFCRKTLRAMEKNSSELVVAGGLARFAYHFHRFAPNAYHWLLQRIPAP